MAKMTSSEIAVTYMLRGKEGFEGKEFSKASMRKAINEIAAQDYDVTGLIDLLEETFGVSAGNGRTVTLGETREYKVSSQGTIHVCLANYKHRDYVTVEFTEDGPVIIL